MLEGVKGKYPYYEGIDKIITYKNGMYAFNIPDKNKEYKVTATSEGIIIDDVRYKPNFEITNALESKKIVMYRVYSVEITTVDINGNKLQGVINAKITSNVKNDKNVEASQIDTNSSYDDSEKISISFRADNKQVINSVAYVECNGMKGELPFSIETGNYKIRRITVILK